tara:strand:+ start:567 stop:1826 length:1260 start_codon:yes stop_codon:yes gene_type:complete
MFRKSSHQVHRRKITKIKKFISLKVIGLICISSLANAQAQQVFEEQSNTIDSSYLQSRSELNDYILDTGDRLYIDFITVPALSGLFTVDAQGEIFFERIKEAYVRGLTISELKTLLEKRYEEFLINPEIYIRITRFRSIRVAVKGEVRKPRLLKFKSYIAPDNSSSINDSSSLDNSLGIYYQSNRRNDYLESDLNSNSLDQSISIDSNQVKRSSDFVATISNAIRQAGGLTSYSDISKIEIIRYVPIGKGGGKKKASINFKPYLNNISTKNDIRLLDGDTIYIPSLNQEDKTIVPLSIISGLTPGFINVTISGRIEKPGSVRIPIEGTLSDAMSLSGPRLPLSGKVFLIRYKKDGTLLRKNINYSAKASPGSARNPHLISGDLITVKNSLLGQASGGIKAITEPFIGIYAGKEVIDSFK